MLTLTNSLTLNKNMLASTAQIVDMFENLDLSPDQISASLDIEKGAVELVLVGNSSKYRSQLAAIQNNGVVNTTTLANTNLFNNDEVQEAARVFISQMMSDDEHIRQRAAKFIINEAKGRNDTKNVKNITQVNVNIVNEQMLRARQAKEDARNKKIEVINV